VSKGKGAESGRIIFDWFYIVGAMNVKMQKSESRKNAKDDHNLKALKID
jgi:hypothetical protein